MCKILLFGGTTEGRELADYLSKKKAEFVVSVATEYGEEAISDIEGIKIETKRRDQKEIESLIQDRHIDLVIDATHPYAQEITKNIVLACEATETEYKRLIRKGDSPIIGAVYVSDTKDCIAYLNKTEGNILLTTGSKELSQYTELNNYKERLYARVLPMPQAMNECFGLGFTGNHLIGMQGPFSEEMNLALLRQIKAKYLVTKDTGMEGGLPEKVLAAKKAGVSVVIIGRPMQGEGLEFKQIVGYLEERLSDTIQRQITLVGIGTGNPDSLTVQACKVLQDSDVILGAKRMIESLTSYEKPMEPVYKKDEMLDFLNENKQYRKISVALSGDVGFYSGAKSLRKVLKEHGYDVDLVSGISSVVYFASKLFISWEDCALVSLHSRDMNIISYVKSNEKVFCLMGGKWSVKELCRHLCRFGLNEVRMTVGENLSYEQECFTSGTPSDLMEAKEDYSSLSVVYIENNDFKVPIQSSGYPDDAFIRGSAPMTKSEIRSIVLSKLQLRKDGIAYDIGAGTGSVAVEMALMASDGMIYAIEREEEALQLIEQNAVKFQVSNVKIIHGNAPEAIAQLPPADSAFIGGSSGNLRGIINQLLEINPEIRIVITAIALETLSEIIEILRELPLQEEEIIHVSVSRSRQAGRYHMMTGQNPIYVISCKGVKADEQNA